MSFTPGDQVVVTDPVQPTRHRGGETGTVINSGTVAGAAVVTIRQSDGTCIGVYPEEITRAENGR